MTGVFLKPVMHTHFFFGFVDKTSLDKTRHQFTFFTTPTAGLFNLVIAKLGQVAILGKLASPGPEPDQVVKAMLVTEQGIEAKGFRMVDKIGMGFEPLHAGFLKKF